MYYSRPSAKRQIARLPFACTYSRSDEPIRTTNTVNVFQSAHLCHNLVNLGRAFDFEANADCRCLVTAIWARVDVVDVDFHLGRNREEFCQHAAAVVTDNRKLDRIILVESDIPADFDHTREIRAVQHVRTVRTMNRNTAPACDISRNRIARNRIAATGKTNHDAAFAFDEDTVT